MKKKRIYWLAVIVCCLFLWGGAGGRTVLAADHVITDFSKIFYIPAGAVLKDRDMQGLREIYDDMGCMAYTEEGEKLYLNVIWDYSAIDIRTAGAYELKGTVQLPEGYVSKAKLPVWTAEISVQNPGQPEIQVYSRMISAGIYYFPWIADQDPDTMTIWMRKEGEDWVNVSEEGYGFCDTDGMYLSCQSMLPGNVYTLTVTYERGKTRNLTYRYGSDGALDVISYQPGTLGDTLKKDRTIRSIESINEKGLQRCMVYAVRVGQSLAEVRADLEETFHILGSTCEEYEDTAAHPSVMMPSVWDFDQVNTAVPGVYKVTGTFTAPQGYEADSGLLVPEAVAYVTVQRPDQPEVQTCCMTGVNTLYFPMVLDAFLDSQISGFQVYLKNAGTEKRVETGNFYFTRKGLYLKRGGLKQNQEYGIYVLYPGGSTGVYTFQYDEDLITNEHWYERNYADRDGKDFPDIDNGPEKVTDTSTIMVGNRLLDLIRMGEKQIPFEKDGVLIEVPTETVKDWEIEDQDQIQVDISREGNGISVKISKNGNEITEIPGAVLKVPYTSEDGEPTLTDEDGNTYTGTVEETQKVAVIPIDKTGEYTVEETPEEEVSEEADTETEDISQDAEEFHSSGEIPTEAQEERKEKDLSAQHKKTASIVGSIVILLILLWRLQMGKGRKLRKGGRGEREQGK